MMKEYNIKDCSDKYHSIMQFNKNKNVFIHRWYPFVEGYSKEFIDSVLNELPFKPQYVLEPFCGSGTTPVELQFNDIHCYSFEVSPFMHLLSKVKLVSNYNINTFCYYTEKIKKFLDSISFNIRDYEDIPFGTTIINNGNLNKWNFHDSAIDGLLDIRYSISTCVNDIVYKDLFNVAFASIIMQSSNLFRNGKCLSYKKDWKTKCINRQEVHLLFLEKLNTVFFEDIKRLSEIKFSVNNHSTCYLGDVRTNLYKIDDNSIDLIITSPPYLNSRDYTDIYMLELKLLRLINSYNELKALRQKTIRSHVQIPLSDVKPINIRLNNVINDMLEHKSIGWNRNLLNMICGYFADINQLFTTFYQKVREGGFIYFNVANSAYYGVEIPVDIIVADIAESCGFSVMEIRKARDLKTSPQQHSSIGKLRESIVILNK